MFYLKVENNQITDQGCKWLAERNWPQLTAINLSSLYLKVGTNQITDQGCKWLAEGNWPQLTTIALGSLYLKVGYNKTTAPFRELFSFCNKKNDKVTIKW